MTWFSGSPSARNLPYTNKYDQKIDKKNKI